MDDSVHYGTVTMRLAAKFPGIFEGKISYSGITLHKGNLSIVVISAGEEEMVRNVISKNIPSPDLKARLVSAEELHEIVNGENRPSTSHWGGPNNRYPNAPQDVINMTLLLICRFFKNFIEIQSFFASIDA